MIKCPECLWNESCWSLEGGSCSNFKGSRELKIVKGDIVIGVTEKDLIDRLSTKYCFLSRYSRLPRKLRPIKEKEL